MAKHTVTPNDDQRRFEIRELFFSTTDRRGVILSGNEVFRRVAAFETLDEMIGKPHNLIRHPDMPRAVFRLFWNYLEQNKPIAAYVKNLAADGAFYWVVALIVPTDGGYLSVRFKPSSPLFDVTQEIYKELLEVEAEAGNRPGLRQAAMENAGQRLVEVLHKKGFADYDDFMRMMLATEMSSRERLIEGFERPTASSGADPVLAASLEMCLNLQRKLDAMFHRVETFLGLIATLQTSSDFLRNLAHQVRLLALNSLVASHHIEGDGLGLTVVANDLARISGDSTAVIGKMTSDVNELVAGLKETAFRISAAKLEVEISITFLGELLSGRSDSQTRERERNDLRMLAISFAQSALDIGATIPLLRQPIWHVMDHAGELKLAVMSLSHAHMIGRVEATHLADVGGFLQLFGEVETQIQAARSELHDFVESVQSLSQELPDFEADSDVLRHGLRSAGAVAA